MATPQKLQLNFHFDAGHGWLEFPKILMVLFAVKPSEFSYQDENNYYLEEDCDAPELLKVLDNAGIKYSFNEVDNGDISPIRSLQYA